MSAPGQEAGCGAPSKEASSRIRPSAASSPKSSPARSGCPVFQRVTQATRTTPSCTSGGNLSCRAGPAEVPDAGTQGVGTGQRPLGCDEDSIRHASRRQQAQPPGIIIGVPCAGERLHHPSHCHGASLTDPKRLPAPSDSSTSAPGRTVRHSLLHREAVAVTPSGDLGDPILARVRTV